MTVDLDAWDFLDSANLCAHHFSVVILEDQANLVHQFALHLLPGFTL